MTGTLIDWTSNVKLGINQVHNLVHELVAVFENEVTAVTLYTESPAKA